MQQARAGAGHHTHGTAGLLDMLGALHVEAGRGTVDTVGVAEGHDGGAGVVGRQVRATVRDAVPGLHVLDRTELRLQCHGGLQVPIAGSG